MENFASGRVFMFLCSVLPVICYIKTRPDAKFSIVPEEGWFGQPKYSTRSKKHSTLCLFLPFIYSSFYLWSRLDHYWSNVGAGSSFRLLAFKTFYSHFVFVRVWTENIFKTELLENDVVTIIISFPYPSFPQTKAMIVAHLHFSCGQKTFQIPPA